MTPAAAVATVAGLNGSAGADAEVGPGLIGFLATFAVVLVTVLLMLDLTRRLRRLRYRADQQAASDRLAASERRARDEGPDAGATAPGTAHTGGITEPTGRQAGRALGAEADDERDR